MADRVDEFPTALPAAGRGRIYDWDSWQDGLIWKLRRGEDWPQQHAAADMAQRCYMRAIRTRMLVTCQQHTDPDGTDSLIVRFYHPEDE